MKAEKKRGFIIPSDAKKGEYATYFEMEHLVQACQDCQAKHILLILDCCYSGHAVLRHLYQLKPEKITDSYLQKITAEKAIQIMAAGNEEQEVSDSGIRHDNSAFTGALLDILESEQDLDKDGILTANEIGSYLAKEVARHAMNQNPMCRHLSGSRSGDFIFGIFNP